MKGGAERGMQHKQVKKSDPMEEIIRTNDPTLWQKLYKKSNTQGNFALIYSFGTI